MIDESHSIGLLKVGQFKWIEKLYNGEVSFSCAKSFIRLAKISGNQEQGDINEAIFARLRKGDQRIDEMQQLLGSDLEIIDDCSHVKLRRKSSCFVPIFCIYSIFTSDFEDQIKSVGKNRVRIDIPEKIYDGFLDQSAIKNVLSRDARIMGVYFQPKPFYEHLKLELNGNYAYRSKKIDYELMKNDEFFITPTDMHDELFYKSPQYEYQHEVRFILHRTKLQTCFDRINVQILPLEKADRHFIADRFFIEASVITELKNN